MPLRSLKLGTTLIFRMKSDSDLVGCITEIGVAFTPEDLYRPNPQQVQKVFEWLAELLMNATRETVEPAMRAAAEDVCGEYMDIVPADTRNLMGFFVSLRQLLVIVRYPASDSVCAWISTRLTHLQ